MAGDSECVTLIMQTVYSEGYQKNGNRQNRSRGCKQSKTA
jgi:hypothetical protein